MELFRTKGIMPVGGEAGISCSVPAHIPPSLWRWCLRRDLKRASTFPDGDGRKAFWPVNYLRGWKSTEVFLGTSEIQ